MSYSCTKCGTHVDDIVQRRGEICFKCHVRTISLGFTYGQEQFHGPTIAEQQRKTVADAKAKGINAEPVGTRWV